MTPWQVNVLLRNADFSVLSLKSHRLSEPESKTPSLDSGQWQQHGGTLYQLALGALVLGPAQLNET